LLALALSAGPAAAGCSGRPTLPAAGSYSDVVLVAGSGAAPAAVAALRGALEAPVADLGGDEPLFRVTLLPETRLGRERFHKNLIVAAPIDAPGAAAALVRRLLPAGDADRLRREGARGFAFEAPFARWQRLVVLTAATPAGLDALLRDAGARLRGELEASAVVRLRDELLVGPADERRAAALRSAHGFHLQTPESYAYVAPPGGWRDAVQLVRASPTRMLTVFWIDGVEAARAARPEFVLGLQRDALWRLHADVLLADGARVAADRLGERPSLVLRGTWQNRTDVAGGPLETHFVHDGAGRLYGVQLQVFAPGRPKHPALRELRALAATFRCGAAAAHGAAAGARSAP
jgi:hypothetical protein